MLRNFSNGRIRLVCDARSCDMMVGRAPFFRPFLRLPADLVGLAGLAIEAEILVLGRQLALYKSGA